MGIHTCIYTYKYVHIFGGKFCTQKLYLVNKILQDILIEQSFTEMVNMFLHGNILHGFSVRNYSICINTYMHSYAHILTYSCICSYAHVY